MDSAAIVLKHDARKSRNSGMHFTKHFDGFPNANFVKTLRKLEVTIEQRT